MTREQKETKDELAVKELQVQLAYKAFQVSEVTRVLLESKGILVLKDRRALVASLESVGHQALMETQETLVVKETLE